MDFRAIGNAIATDAFDEQKIQGDAYVAAHAPPPIPAADPDSIAFAQLMSRIMGTAIVTHCPGYGGTVTSAPNTGVGVDLPIPSIVVQVDGGGAWVAVWWKSGPAATEWVPLGGSSAALSTENPLPDGVADPGDVASGIGTARRHVHPLVPASANGGKLWTAFLPDRFQRSDVDAVFCEETGCAPHLFVNWTQIATGVWRRDYPGGLLAGDTDNVSAFVGMRVLAWAGNLSSDERINVGIYVITETGQGQGVHYAQMERAADYKVGSDVYSGIYVHVIGGDIYGGLTIQLQTSDPIELGVTPLDWEIVSPPTPAPTKELLTAVQLSLAAPDAVTAAAEVSANTGEQDLVTCIEHDAVLGGAVIPGDQPFRFHVRAWVVADDPAATTVVRCYLRGTNGSFVLIATTQALHNETAGDFVAVGTWGADYPLAIGEKLEVVFRAESDSTTSVRVNLMYNNAAHSTYIEVPMAIGYAGTDDHQQLIHRGVFLNPVNAPLLAHPMSDIEPGVVHSPCGAVITTTAGRFTMPNANTAHIDGAEPLLGIANVTTGGIPWQVGDCITVWIAQPRIVQGDGSVPTGYSPIYLPPAVFVDPNSPAAGPQAQAAADNFLELMFSGTKWMHRASSLG